MKSRIIALLALFSLLLALPVGTGLAQSEFEGTGVIFDDAAMSDAIAINMSNVPAPSSGTELVAWLVPDYEAWLVDEASWLSLGPMELSDGSVSHTFDSNSPRYTGENLIAAYGLLVITEETAGADPDAPAGSPVYHFEQPAAALAQIRNLLADSPEGILANAMEQLEIARNEATLGKLESTADGAKARGQRVLDVIEGADGVISHLADTQQIGFARQAAPDSEAVAEHGALAEITAANTANFVNLAVERIQSLVLPSANQGGCHKAHGQHRGPDEQRPDRSRRQR